MESGRNFPTLTKRSKDSFTKRSVRRNQKNASTVNVHEAERVASAIGGGVLTVFGLNKGGVGGFALALLGGGLAWRGLSGHCMVYNAMGISTAAPKNQAASIQEGQGIKVEKSVTINKAAKELFQFWSNLENLPRFMKHLQSVQVTGDKNSHWVAKTPLGTTVEWDAEIINKKEDELIAWQSVEGATVPNAGSVRFEQHPGGSGTIVKVALNYAPPGGAVGAAFAKLFGEEPEQQVEEDLRRFKQFMETGEIASVEGQSSGRQAATAR